MQENNEQMIGEQEFDNRYLEFSCQKIEICVKPGEEAEGSFDIIGAADTEGSIHSTDTRMRCEIKHFAGEMTRVSFIFDGTNQEADTVVAGEMIILSNKGEYILPYEVSVIRPIIQSSLGGIRNLFHFANLAKASWQEAVDIFYSKEFLYVFQENEKHLMSSYKGLSHYAGNQRNVEEFLIECNKKNPVTYTTDVEGFHMEDIFDSINKSVTITKNGWGYTNLQVIAEGDFLQLQVNTIQSEDFVNQICCYIFNIDATKLNKGLNAGKIIIKDTCNHIEIPVNITNHISETEKENVHREQNALLQLVEAYVNRKLKKISREMWLDQSEAAISELEEINPGNLMNRLYKVQMLLTKERFNEAKAQLDSLDERKISEGKDVLARCYYYYLYTLFNRDESYLEAVINEIENAYGKNPSEWRLALLLLYMDEELGKNPKAKWEYIEEQFALGCSSPVFLCEAVMLLQNNPTLIYKLDSYELNVIWFAARTNMIKTELVELIHYLTARQKVFSPLLYRILCRIYDMYKMPETVTAICQLLIAGDKKGSQYFEWFALGVEQQARVIKLYEYYMMSVSLDYEGELPMMILMYFAYQSTLDYEKTAFLYAYVIRNKDKYPELEQSYRIAIERFIVDQIKSGHINDSLAYLYQNVLAPQMLRDETAYAFTPLLFTHKLVINNPDIKSVSVIHEKIMGESMYPVKNGICLVPVYGEEYKLFLQDEEGNRYTESVPYENIKLLEQDSLLKFIGKFMEGRLSFDIYQCERDKNYIVISRHNVKRFQHLVDSEQVLNSFKKEIRTKLLEYYYENDMIGELDTFLEETEAELMEKSERAEFIRYLISRSMFDKAYRWLRCYGVAGVEQKSVARLVTNRIVSNQYMKDEFLVNVAFYIYKSTKYDEPILKYLMMYYEGTTRELKNIWKSAEELELSTTGLQYRILKQIKYTNIALPEKYDMLVSYDEAEDHDESLASEMFNDVAYDYFVRDIIIKPEVISKLYDRYRRLGEINAISKLALLKYWGSNPTLKDTLPKETVTGFIDEFLKKDRYFSFFKGLADVAPQLHYFSDKMFVEYRTTPGSSVKIHYLYDIPSVDNPVYKIEELKEMCDGIYVKAFNLFHGEVLQYYISETRDGEDIVTISNAICEDIGEKHKGRYAMLNDCLVSMSMKDDITAREMFEEYIYQDYLTRDLFRVI